MTDPHTPDATPRDDEPLSLEELARLEGTPLPIDQDAYVEPSEIADDDEGVTDTELYEGEAPGGPGADEERQADEGLGEDYLQPLTSLELRAGETDNPDVAAEEGEAWVPPVDPPVVADRDAAGGVTVAAGFGTTAEDEPFDADHHSSALPADDEVSARVREALLADGRTSRLADRLEIETVAGRVIVRGMVEDLDDGDLIAEVATGVTGVTDVVDETEVPGL